jgi:hypothetical protein
MGDMGMRKLSSTEAQDLCEILEERSIGKSQCLLRNCPAVRSIAWAGPTADVCRQLGCSEASFYISKKRYGNLEMTEVKELRQLRDENARSKRLVADTHVGGVVSNHSENPL